jgi:DNA replication protein DnaC
MPYDINRLSFLKARWLMNTSNIPHRFIGMGAEDVQGNLGSSYPEIEDWVDLVLAGKVIKSIGGLGVTGVGLLFDGDPGMGKTTHSVLTISELIRKLPEDADKARKVFNYAAIDYTAASRPVYYMTVPDFINRKKNEISADNDTRRELQMYMDGFHGRSKHDYLNVRILILDDLGKELKSDYNVAGFDELLRSRYDKGLPTIVTTNLERDQWKAKYGEAMGSFVYEAFNRVIIGGKDLRRNK